jgi:NIMA (never in mitosis gene a)-related kinase
MERYELREQVGQGNYGTCHLVFHLVERRQYVVKRIPVFAMAERGEALREAQLLSKIKHPNVIAYKESFLCDGDKTLCIVTAYAEEGDLFMHIRRAREAGRHFSERQVLDWVAQIALALDHIHHLRVLHRDLKTQNIFLGRGGVVKLGDFGISRVLERTDDFATTVTGTPYYMAPEVCTSQPYTFKSDVWSLGCVAYEIATLRHAFAADSLLSLVYQIVNGTCPPIPEAAGYDSRLGALVASLLDRDAARRPTVAQVLQTPVMQQHLRRMQEEGLGRSTTAAGRSGGTARYDHNLKAAPKKAKEQVSKVEPMTPREQMVARRRHAAEVRQAELKSAAGTAAAAHTNVARERFQLEFHARPAVAENGKEGGGAEAEAEAKAEHLMEHEGGDSSQVVHPNGVGFQDLDIHAATTSDCDVSLPGGGTTLHTATITRLKGLLVYVGEGEGNDREGEETYASPNQGTSTDDPGSFGASLPATSTLLPVDATSPGEARGEARVLPAEARGDVRGGVHYGLRDREAAVHAGAPVHYGQRDKDVAGHADAPVHYGQRDKYEAEHAGVQVHYGQRDTRADERVGGGVGDVTLGDGVGGSTAAAAAAATTTATSHWTSGQATPRHWPGDASLAPCSLSAAVVVTEKDDMPAPRSNHSGAAPLDLTFGHQSVSSSTLSPKL